MLDDENSGLSSIATGFNGQIGRASSAFSKATTEVTHIPCHSFPHKLNVTFSHTIAASRGLKKLLCAVWIGDERYGNERNEHKKRRLLVWPPLRLREHQRPELHQMCRASYPRRELRASPHGSATLSELTLVLAWLANAKEQTRRFVLFDSARQACCYRDRTECPQKGLQGEAAKKVPRVIHV
jgi:hypothetical protein